MTQDHVFPFLMAGGFILFIIILRLAAGGLDDGRVRDYITARGGRLLSLKWSPFGRGWAGSRDERIYEVRYLNGEGHEHAATCKTSMFSGVYFTEDQVIAGGQPSRR